MNDHERAAVLQALQAFDATLDFYVDLDAPFENGEREILHDAEQAVARLRQLTNASTPEPVR